MSETSKPARESSGERARVVVTDFDMPFGSMITFMVKWAFASIPALIVIWTFTFVAFMVLSTLAGGALGILANMM